MNLLSVLAGAAAAMVISRLWYSSFLFGKICDAGRDKDKAKDKKKLPALFVIYLVLSAAVHYFVEAVGVLSIPEALILAVILWAVIAAVIFNAVLWEGKPLKLYFVVIFNYLAILSVVSLIAVFLE